MANTSELTRSAALTGAMNLHTQTTDVSAMKTRLVGLLIATKKLLRKSAIAVSSIVTALLKKTTTAYLSRKEVCAPAVENRRTSATQENIKKTNCALITATAPAKYDPFYVTAATSQSGTATPQKPSLELQSTYGVSRAKIAEITPYGEHLVYDIEVTHTENFIADGIVSHNTRWAENDLIGKLQQDMVRNPESDQWEVVEFPALFERADAPPDAEEKEKYTALWPEQWPVESLLRTKASMPGFQWSAQYLQQPTSRDAAIIKRDWWSVWEKDNPPAVEYIIMSLDAAAEKNNRADFSALTTWGVFYRDSEETGKSAANIILLNSIKERMEFPELKRRAYEEYKFWEPDWFVVEKKSAGTALYQEFRRAGIPVQEITPTRASGDKIARLNSVSDIFASGMVWYPAGRRWAEEVVDEVCGFPAMPHDDLVDSTVYALMRFRTGGFIALPSDRWDEDDDRFEPVRAAYY